MPEAPQPAAEPQTTARYRALLDISETISRHLELDELFRALAARLQPLIGFDLVAFVLYDAAADKMRLRTLSAEGPALTFPSEIGREDSISAWAMDHQQTLCYGTLQGETRWAPILDVMRGGGMQSCCVLPLTTAAARLGALTIASRRPNAYSPEDMEFLQHAAQQMAVSIENALNRRNAGQYQAQLEQERDRLQLILEMNNVLVSNLDLHELFPRISACLRGLVRHDYASLALHDPENEIMRLRALVFPGGKGLVHEELVYPVDGSPAGWVMEHGEPLLLDRLDVERFPAEVTRRMRDEGVQSAIFLPLQTRNGVLGTMSVASREPSAFRPEDVALLAQMARQVAIAVENALAFQQIALLKDKLASERLYLEDEIRTQYNFEEIVGDSPALHHVLQQVETVAPTTASVLILGETGTGKELIARAIHNLSPRRERTFVKLSCAAIPTGLLESELFGHEKGAFTGALTQKIGRFELADRGTVFLDEVGEIPLDLQPKLLRALALGEVRPVGESAAHAVDVRVVAASNRDLEADATAGRFRADLLARLGGWRIHVPPLRARREDTLPLAKSMLAGRSVALSADAAEALLLHDWPANVRELELALAQATVRAQADDAHVIVLRNLPSAIADRLAGRSAPSGEGGTPSAGDVADDAAPPSARDLAEALERHDDNISAVAREFGKERRQIYRWMERHGLARGRKPT